MKRRFWLKKKIYPFTLSPRWQKLPYICNNFFYYNNLRIIFSNYRTIEKSPYFCSWANVWYSTPLKSSRPWVSRQVFLKEHFRFYVYILVCPNFHIISVVIRMINFVCENYCEDEITLYFLYFWIIVASRAPTSLMVSEL